MYYGYKILEVFTLGIHCGAFALLFWYLDPRFKFLGYDYFSNKTEVDAIFPVRAHCWSSRNSFIFDDVKVPERQYCGLLQNEHYQAALIFLWFLYAIGIMFQALYLGIQCLIVLTCLEKRWQMFWIKLDLHDFYYDILALKSDELFVIGLLSKQCDPTVLLSFAKVLRKKDLRSDPYEEIVH